MGFARFSFITALLELETKMRQFLIDNWFTLIEDVESIRSRSISTTHRLTSLM
ncbi:hypothetical protein PALA111701_31080 [Paenibacillus lactis]